MGAAKDFAMQFLEMLKREIRYARMLESAKKERRYQREAKRLEKRRFEMLENPDFLAFLQLSNDKIKYPERLYG